MFGLRTVKDWTFLAFFVVLAQTATLYLMAALVLPESVEASGVDLKGYYLRHNRWFFGWFLATLAVSITKDVVLTGRLPSSENLAFHGVLAAACVVAMVIRRYRAHQVMGLAFAAIIATYIGLLFTHLR